MVPVNQGRLERRIRSAIEGIKHNVSSKKGCSPYVSFVPDHSGNNEF